MSVTSVRFVVYIEFTGSPLEPEGQAVTVTFSSPDDTDQSFTLSEIRRAASNPTHPDMQRLAQYAYEQACKLVGREDEYLVFMLEQVAL